MKSTHTLLPVLVGLSFSLGANAKPWNSDNDPALMGKYEYQLNKLPTSGELPYKPWSETYWPTNRGSINIRWNQDYPKGFDYETPSRGAVLGMSRDELARLSPAEKWDIYLGDYSFKTHKDVAAYSSPWVPWWKGLCNGWSMSAIQFAEPQPIDLPNPDGVKVPFGSSDIKGILSYYAQFYSGVGTTYVGQQCDTMGGWFGSDGCEDINPGAMHVILTNQLGIQKKGFMMDRDPGKQIWNQPVYGFKSEIRGSTSTGVQVHTTLFYTDELDESLVEPVVGTDKFSFDKMEMDYTLDLDYSGRIVGGEYLNNSTHPDQFWNTTSKIKFTGDFAKLKNLAKDLE